MIRISRLKDLILVDLEYIGMIIYILINHNMAYNKKAVDKYIESLTEAFSYVSPKLDAYEEVEEIEE
jgi:hypothetical protein